MASEQGKVAVTLDRLYKASIDPTSPIMKTQGKPSLSISGGTANIYGITPSDGNEPAALSDMKLQSGNTSVEGSIGFDLVPEYIAVTENVATIDEVIAEGLVLTNIKAIS